MLLTQCLQTLDEPGDGLDHVHVARDRLDDDGGNFVTGLTEYFLASG